MADDQSTRDLSIETADALLRAVKEAAGDMSDLLATSAGEALASLAQAYAAVEGARPKSSPRAGVIR